MMVSPQLIRHYDQHQKLERETADWLPPGKLIVGVTAGASCPNNLIEDVIHRLFEFRNIKINALLET
jgi:4-hydroxy-3-methylbut-2-enyl diphosphate reductase